MPDGEKAFPKGVAMFRNLRLSAKLLGAITARPGDHLRNRLLDSAEPH